MKNSKSDFQNIPGVGPNMEKHLLLLGYKSISDLKGENPEQMYEKDKLIHGENLDRCVFTFIDWQCTMLIIKNMKQKSLNGGIGKTERIGINENYRWWCYCTKRI